MKNKRFEQNLADSALQKKILEVKSNLGNKNATFEKKLQSCNFFLLHFSFKLSINKKNDNKIRKK